MEPMMEVNIIVPEEFMGEVVGDLKARKSSVEAITPKGEDHDDQSHRSSDPDVRILHGLEIPYPRSRDLYDAIRSYDKAISQK